MNGPDRIAAAFAAARDDGRAALIPFLAAGDPGLDATVRMAAAAADAGADLIELGVPYSDPLADGPVIQAAYTRALAAGATLDGLFGAVARIALADAPPVILMTSVSPVLARGPHRFCDDAAAAGAAGLLVPDLLPEDGAAIREAAAAAGLATVCLTVPWGAPERTRAAAAASTGFVYLVSRRGVTGEGGPGGGLDREVARVRAHTALPVAVGFGVAGPEDAAAVAAVADGVIVGSALVRAARDAVLAGDDPADEVARRVRALRLATKKPTKAGFS